MSATLQETRHQLSRHPASPYVPLSEVSFSTERDGGSLAFSFRVVGCLDALALPEPRDPARVDGLWRHTCFEIFVGRPLSSAYVEYNFSPSGEWAAYHFNAYRADMQPHELDAGPVLVTRIEFDTLVLTGTVDLRWLATGGGSARLGVTAVIEDLGGTLSYWALKHPSEKPDFHHADGFVLDLEV